MHDVEVREDIVGHFARTAPAEVRMHFMEEITVEMFQLAIRKASVESFVEENAYEIFNDMKISIQFPWRLLVFLSLLMSLYAPSILLYNKITNKPFTEVIHEIYQAMRFRIYHQQIPRHNGTV